MTKFEMRFMKHVLLAASIALAAPAAMAATINMPGTFTPSAPVEDFEGYAIGATGPITSGIMTVSTSGSWSVRGQAYTQYADIFEGQYFGQGADSFTISFSTDIMAVGFGLFDPNFANTKVEAYDRAGNLLESLAPPLGPPGGSFSTYVGFSRVEGDIASILVTPQAGDLLAVDNISWKVAELSQVPLPASLWMLGAALGGLRLSRSRKKA